MKVYEAIAAACVAEGQSPVFALMGDGNMELLSALDERDAGRVVHTRHENAAVAMADGWARVSGDVGVCTVTSGPGLTQVATSLVVAARHGSPLVVLAGDTPRLAPYNLQGFAQERFAAACEAAFVPLRSPGTALDDVREAFLRARCERRPVVLGMPMDIQQDTYPWEAVHEPSARSVPRTPPVSPSADDLREIATMLTSCEKVVVLGGRGATGSGRHLVELADRLGALLATSLRGKGLFDGNEWDLGIAGAFSSSGARALFAEADGVVAFGAGLGYYTTEGGYLFPGATIVQVDTRPRGVFEGQRPAHVQITGDAGMVARKLSALVAGSAPRTAYRAAAKGVLSGERGTPAGPAGAGGLDPATVLRTIDEAVPASAPVVVGAGHFWNFAVPALTGRPPEKYVFTYDFGCIGQGLPVAMGVARHSGRTFVVEGDGSLLMNVQELETLARHRAPVLCFVMNDGAYGAEVHKLRAKGMRGEQAAFGRTDLAAVADALGVRAVRVTSPEQIGPAVEEFMASGAPTVVDVHISPEVISPTYRRLYYGEAE
ncbi:thiamine pyrophosphate-dependent enzyme [Sphaerisporangium rubeum]|uniref:Thiamine pyrophosphate-dependent acetolactate synthase large subunit-like protein n=3 Tax=Sphaerisporangium rubeum TaxID=321317 RepID=A0A7X0IDK9_9ACTN|nr:thiamine pyrophosphate-dependent acetolactate synthase large subunit-like protein [Sphaerisporangium rubeum]